MTLTDFVSVIESRAFDESKHVNYTLGMLLGTEEFQQEFAYLSGQDRRRSRQTAGYGTLVGLRVTLDTNDAVKGARVMVEPGSALTPRGHLVCVRPGQCAYLNEWLSAKRTQLERDGVVAPGIVDVHIVLGYRDCPTDNVLIPGSPCRDEDELKVASRIADSFILELRHKAPLQNEELAIIDFVNWLRQIPLGGINATDFADFETAVAASGQLDASPPEQTLDPGMTRLHFNPPPASLRIDAQRVDEYLRAAFRVWTTRLRPLVHSLCCGGQGCCAGKPAGVTEPEDLLLLGTVSFPVGADWRVDTTASSPPPPPLVLDETQRPTLLHTRMVQELALTGGAQQAAAQQHRLVAAGVINSPAGIVFGGLAGNSTVTGKLKLTFNDYQDPRTSPPSFTYLVNAMLTNSSIDNPKIAFDTFDVDGIVLNITQGGALLGSAAINAIEFRIEVSRLG